MATGLIKRSIPWRTKPPYPTGIDRRNPLTRQLTVAIPFNRKFYNLASRQYEMTLGIGAVDFEAGRMVVDDAADVRLDIPKAALGITGATVNADLTVFVLADAHKGPIASGDQALVCTSASDTNQDLILYFDDLGTNGRLTCFEDSTNSKVSITGTEPNFDPGIIESYASTFIASSDTAKLYLNGGNAVGGDEASGSMPYAETIASTGIPYFSKANDVGAEQFDGDVYLLLAWDRTLVDAEIASLHKNPWQVFTPRTILIPVESTVIPPPPPPIYRRQHIGFLGV